MKVPFLKEAFDDATHGLSEILGKDLPFHLNTWLEQKGRYHTLIHANWVIDHGRRPYHHCPVSITLAFVNNEGRENGYKNGIADIRINSHFSGLGIGKILVKNALELFRKNGVSNIDVNTRSMGAQFWQSLGFTAASEERDLNDNDDIFSDWGEENFYHSHAQQVQHVLTALEKLKKNVREENILTPEQCDSAIKLIDKDDPQSIWNFLDLKHKVIKRDGFSRRVETYTLPELVLADYQVALEFSLTGNSQLQRFAEKTDHVSIDKKDFGKTTARYIATIRTQYEAQRDWDEVMSRRI